MTRFAFTEAAERTLVELPDEVAHELIRAKAAIVEPEASGMWRISSVSKVGSFRVNGHQLDIAPKTTIAALSFLLGYERSQRFWRHEDVISDENAHPSVAIAFSLGRLVSRATAGGVLRGYHTENSEEMTLRGRWDLATQIKRRPGSSLPLHLTTDEFDADIPVNQILASATDLLLREPNVRGPARLSLLQLSRRFEDVSLLQRGFIPTVVMNRLNAHYAGALHLARIVLRSGSLQQLGGRNASAGFLLTMSTVFEQFLGESIAHATSKRGLRSVEQDRSSLDTEGLMHIKPDIVIYRGVTPIAVIDAKYKVEKSDRFPNADVYQAITYALRLGLREAHLVYAKGESEPRQMEIIGAGVRVHVHALDLELPPARLLESIERLVDSVARHAADSNGLGARAGW